MLWNNIPFSSETATMYVATVQDHFWNKCARLHRLAQAQDKHTPSCTHTSGGTPNCFVASVVWLLCSLVTRLLCVGGEKRAWYTLFTHAQLPQDFWEFGNFRKSCLVTLTFARHADWLLLLKRCHWPHFMWMTTMKPWKDSARCLQKLFMPSSIPAKRCDTWLMQSFPLKLTNHLEQSNADRYCQSDIVSDSKIGCMCLISQGVL